MNIEEKLRIRAAMLTRVGDTEQASVVQEAAEEIARLNELIERLQRELGL